MSYCLTLGIIKNDGMSHVMTYDRLRVDTQDEDLFELIRAAATPLGAGVYWWSDDGCKRLSTDAYDFPLTFVTSFQLALLLGDVHLDPWDAALKAFMVALPPATRVVLFWN